MVQQEREEICRRVPKTVVKMTKIIISANFLRHLARQSRKALMVPFPQLPYLFAER